MIPVRLRIRSTDWCRHLSFRREDNPVRAIDVFVEELDLADVGFAEVDPEATGRPSYHPSVLLKLTSTATSIGFNRAVGWSVRLVAMLK
jgi:transposase